MKALSIALIIFTWSSAEAEVLFRSGSSCRTMSNATTNGVARYDASGIYNPWIWRVSVVCPIRLVDMQDSSSSSSYVDVEFRDENAESVDDVGALRCHQEAMDVSGVIYVGPTRYSCA